MHEAIERVKGVEVDPQFAGALSPTDPKFHARAEVFLEPPLQIGNMGAGGRPLPPCARCSTWNT
ncbi:MAG: hypothetical protein ACKOGJ_01255, partial [Phycisphaerales bacterium]